MTRPARLWAFLRRDPLLTVSTVALSLAVLAPLTLTPILPLTDLGNHMGMSSVLKHLWHGDQVAREHFMVQPHPAPYWLTYLLMLGAMLVLPTLWAAKAVVAVALLSIPLGTMRLLKALGRSPRLGLWAFGLCWDFSVSYGFIAYTLTMGLALWFTARCLEALADEGQRWPSLGGTALLGLLLAQSHAHVTGVACVMVFLLALCELPYGRRALKGVLLSAVPALGLLPWVLLGSGAAGGARPAEIGHWPNVGDKLSALFYLSLDVATGTQARNLAGLAFLVLLIAPLLLSLGGEGDRPARRRSLVLYLAGWALYLVMPASLDWPFYQLFIFERHATLVLLLGLLLPGGTFRGLKALWLVPGVAAAMAMVVVVSAQFKAFSAEVSPFLPVLEAIKPGSRVAEVLWQHRTPESVRDTLPQLPAYILAEKGGYTPFLFQTPNLPTRYVDGARLPSPQWNQPAAFTLQEHGVFFDYVLVQGKQSDRLKAGPVKAADGTTVNARVLVESGLWRLYVMER